MEERGLEPGEEEGPRGPRGAAGLEPAVALVRPASLLDLLGGAWPGARGGGGP